jgi:hypothetical protein
MKILLITLIGLLTSCASSWAYSKTLMQQCSDISSELNKQLPMYKSKYVVLKSSGCVPDGNKVMFYYNYSLNVLHNSGFTPI